MRKVVLLLAISLVFMSYAEPTNELDVQLLSVEEMQYELDTREELVEIISNSLSNHTCMGYVDGTLTVVQYSDGDSVATITWFFDGVPVQSQMSISAAESFCRTNVGFAAN